VTLNKSLAAGLVCGALLAAGCNPGSDDSSRHPNGASGAGNGGGAGSSGSPLVPLDSPPGFAPVRRLTHVEYDNTVADLLGDTTAPASAFSADVAQDGFTNNAQALNVSPALAEQYLAAAESLSKAATKNLDGLLGCKPALAGEAACVQQFIRDFGKRAWRRPLSAEEQGRLYAVFDEARVELPLETAVQMVVEVMLQSPQFIYLLEPITGAASGSVRPLDSWQVASRLSYFLLGSMPDATLLAEAEKGALVTTEQVTAQARRLLTLPRAWERVGLFFTEWMQLRNVDRMQKDPALFPGYGLALGPALKQQVQLFARYVIFDKAGSAADLFTAPYTFMSPELAPIYGVQPPPTPGFSKVDLDPTRRAGLLTHAGILASLAKSNQTDPVHRGKFVRERLLCGTVPPPPVNANITPPAVRADATTRQRFTQHRSDPSCAGCHALMDPIGLGFEHYDALGQWRDAENGLPIDATGDVTGSDVAGPFDGALALSQKLAQSQQVKDCLVQTWFRFAHGRAVTDADEDNLAILGAAFAANQFRITELMVAVTQTHAFRYQLVPSTTGGMTGQVQP
jgi:hypothetical protein